MLNARGGVHDSLINPLARSTAPRGYFTVVRRNSGPLSLSLSLVPENPATTMLCQFPSSAFTNPFAATALMTGRGRPVHPRGRIGSFARAGCNPVIRARTPRQMILECARTEISVLHSPSEFPGICMSYRISNWIQSSLEFQLSSDKDLNSS